MIDKVDEAIQEQEKLPLISTYRALLAPCEAARLV
jgi:hypothetical protein